VTLLACFIFIRRWWRWDAAEIAVHEPIGVGALAPPRRAPRGRLARSLWAGDEVGRRRGTPRGSRSARVRSASRGTDKAQRRCLRCLGEAGDAGAPGRGRRSSPGPSRRAPSACGSRAQRGLALIPRTDPLVVGHGRPSQSIRTRGEGSASPVVAHRMTPEIFRLS
jgi:hypothetical protein